MDDAEKLVTIIFGGILTIAVVSVIVGRSSQAPQAIGAFSNGIASVVSAAVSPAAISGGAGNGNSTFSSAQDALNSANSIISQFNNLSNFGL